MSLQNLLDARDNLDAEYLALTATMKTSYSVDGRSFQHDQHRLQVIKEEIAALDDRIIKRNPAAELRTSILG